MSNRRRNILDFRFIIVLIVIVYLLLAFGGCLDEQTHLPSAVKPLPTTQEYLAHAQDIFNRH